MWRYLMFFSMHFEMTSACALLDGSWRLDEEAFNGSTESAIGDPLNSIEVDDGGELVPSDDDEIADVSMSTGDQML